MSATIIDKIWDLHTVKSVTNDVDVLYIDQHFIHEVTSPQAFSGLDEKGIKVLRPRRTTAVADHNVPTINQHLKIENELSRNQVDTLTKNCEKHQIELFGIGHEKNGIVHVIGPENGITQPGMTIVCGDSHTSTHGAFGAIAFGIGTSQVEQVLASQCLLLSRPKTMRITVHGDLGSGVSSKDVVLHIIAKLGAEGATGHFIEFTGDVFSQFSMEERMTVCNMSIEMGARGGLMGIDNTTIEYVQDRAEINSKKIALWNSLNSDVNAVFDKEFGFDATTIEPMITTGTSPDTGIGIRSKINSTRRNSVKGLTYMGLANKEQMLGTKIDYVFIGSCTNGRIEDLRAVASIVQGHKKAENVTVWVVPGSKEVRKQAYEEGLNKVFEEAGFEFREPGCSACLAMNDDKIPSGAVCISTSNRNFEGRQGDGARTILASPLTAAASALKGKITDPRIYLN
ncbi:MAG: 3-isopropylmalate/(R)-2-methylmalate dehydratase large subunit [Crocinitomicaceae bacterium]|jgi:3-isopropylmalate/(R)-2-methylmalate dehydratase large subunit